MSENPVVSRDEALKLHRAGELAAARAAYEALAEADPGDADVLGLLGVVAVQEGRAQDAEALLRRALEAGGDPRTRLRNLNSLLVLLQQSGRRADAEALLAEGLPEWPADAVPDPTERGVIMSVAEAALLLDRPETGWQLMSRTLGAQREDPEVQGLAGRLQLAMGRPEAALVPLERASAKSRDPRTLIAYAAAQQGARQADPAKATMEKLYRLGRFYSGPSAAGQQASVLVLNPWIARISDVRTGLRGLHFNGGFADGLETALRGDFRFHSLLLNLPAEDLPKQGPHADIVVNNLVDAEAMNMAGRREAQEAMLERLGLPVINPPAQVFTATRQKNAEALGGIDGLTVPFIERYSAAKGEPGEIAADILETFGLPAILRGVGAYDRRAVLAETEQALRDELEGGAWREFYAIEHLELRRPDGLFRRIRAVWVGRTLVVSQAALSDGWRVPLATGGSAPAEECGRILADPEGTLGAGVMEVLEAVRDAIPLDVFAIDFEVDGDGDVVLFKATAAADLVGTAAAGDGPDGPAGRIRQAFRDLVAARIAEAARREKRQLQ